MNVLIMDNNNRKLILVAEDDNSNFLIDKYFLRKKYNVEHAVDGIDVIEKCEELNPDLILMDIHMPNLNGVEAMKRIKSKHPELPILALTAFADYGEEQIYMSYGFDAFLVKPIELKAFHSAISSFLEPQ